MYKLKVLSNTKHCIWQFNKGTTSSMFTKNNPNILINIIVYGARKIHK